MAIKKALSNQPIIFAFGLVLFLIAAAFGWEKLQYGFSYTGEGYYMTESWRLAAGDHFLKDKFTGAISLYTLLNSLIFKMSPDITLLGFRKLQYLFTISSLILFSIALFSVGKQYWYQPFIFSLFAYTGVSPGWTSSNLEYHTYPHFFLTFHLSFLILGLCQKNTIFKRLMYVASGLFLWAISFVLLHLSIIAFSPILLFLILSKLRLKSFSFIFEDLCYVLVPFIFCWTVFIGIYNKAFILNVIRSVSIISSYTYYSPKALITINWEALKHIGVSLLILLIYTSRSKKPLFSVSIAFLAVISLLTFFIIDTSLFGLITPYHHVFSRQMWFSSLLIAVFIMFLFDIVKKHYINQQYNKGKELSIILLIPCAILFLSSSVFSTPAGVLMALYCSIPAIAAITNIILYHRSIYMKSYLLKLSILTIFFTPFYYTTVWAEWKLAFFDVFPEQANVSIEKGFGKGIKTNRIYHNLYEWIRIISDKYTEKDDFMITGTMSPMVHMISKLRPSLDDSLDTFRRTFEYQEKSIELMKKRGRHPKIAFVFEYPPAYYPKSLKEKKFKWSPRHFVFPSEDLITKYIMENMIFLKKFKIIEGNIVRCFVDSKMVNHGKNN